MPLNKGSTSILLAKVNTISYDTISFKLTRLNIESVSAANLLLGKAVS